MNTTKTNEFEQVDINAFIEPAEISKREEAEKAEVFTQKQRDLLNQIMPILLQNDKERYELFLNRIVDMENIASSVAKFPSLLERRELAGGTRTRANLIESLIKHKDDGDRMLRLPSKAIFEPADLLEENNSYFAMGRFFSSKTFLVILPTTPVVPTKATLYLFIINTITQPFYI